MELQDRPFANKNIIQSFTNASKGIIYAFRSEPNIKKQTLVAVLVICAGLYFKITKIEWCLLVFAIALVISTELANTGVERVVDLVCGDQYHILAKISKDVMAGAVVVSAIGAIVIGLIIFYPYVSAIFS